MIARPPCFSTRLISRKYVRTSGGNMWVNTDFSRTTSNIASGNGNGYSPERKRPPGL